MATSKQEQTYNEIVEYYSYSDRLLTLVENSDHELSQEQFKILEEVTTCLEDCADQLTTKYIEFVKSGDSQKTIDQVRNSINNIITKIGECRNKILMLYNCEE